MGKSPSRQEVRLISIKMSDDRLEFFAKSTEGEIVLDSFAPCLPHAVPQRRIDKELHHHFGKVSRLAFAQEPRFAIDDSF